MEEDNCNNRPHNRFEHVTFETIIYVLERGSVRVVLETRVSKTFAADCTAYTEILPRPSPSVLSLSRVSTTETNEISLGRLSFRPTHTGAFRRGKRRTPSRPPFFFFSATVLIPRNHFSCSRCCLWKNRGRERGSSNNMVKSFKRVPAT